MKYRRLFLILFIGTLGLSACTEDNLPGEKALNPNHDESDTLSNTAGDKPNYNYTEDREEAPQYF